MSKKYKELDGELRKLRWDFTDDLFGTQLKIHRTIDRFYQEEHMENNELLIRKTKLERALDRCNTILVPVFMTVLFGISTFGATSLLEYSPFRSILLSFLNLSAENVFASEQNVQQYVVYGVQIGGTVLALLALVLIGLFLAILFLPLPIIHIIWSFTTAADSQKKYECEKIEEKLQTIWEAYDSDPNLTYEKKQPEDWISQIFQNPKRIIAAIVLTAMIIGYFWKQTFEIRDVFPLIAGASAMYAFLPRKR